MLKNKYIKIYTRKKEGKSKYLRYSFNYINDDDLNLPHFEPIKNNKNYNKHYHRCNKNLMLKKYIYSKIEL